MKNKNNQYNLYIVEYVLYHLLFSQNSVNWIKKREKLWWLLDKMKMIMEKTLLFDDLTFQFKFAFEFHMRLYQLEKLQINHLSTFLFLFQVNLIIQLHKQYLCIKTSRFIHISFWIYSTNYVRMNFTVSTFLFDRFQWWTCPSNHSVCRPKSLYRCHLLITQDNPNLISLRKCLGNFHFLPKVEHLPLCTVWSLFN